MVSAYDVVIIGAGVTGCAIARELSKYDLKTALLDKEAEASFGASKANSGIVHAGFHSAAGMLKSALCVRGNYLYGVLKDELDIPFERVGELMVARGEEEEKKLEFYLNQGIALGVPDLKIVRGDELKALEPHLSKDITAALYAKSAGVVNPYEFTYRLLYNAVQNGVKFYPNAQATGFDGGIVHTPAGDFKAKFIINAAGVHADDVAALAGVKTFEIKARKGQEYLLDRKCKELVRHVIFPLPTPTSKGVLVIPTLDGTVMIGPSAEDTPEKEKFNTTNEIFEDILAKTQSMIPAVSAKNLISAFAGLRPVATGDDFIIGPTARKGFINAAGIQSPGLTAAPAVAEYMADILKKEGLTLTPKENFNPRVPRHFKMKDLSESELAALIAQNKQYGKVVCRCEKVSEAEIRQAIREGATTLDGVKLRTRAGMGRCQGGFCTYRILEIMSEELGLPLTEITKKGAGSRLVEKDLKQ